MSTSPLMHQVTSSSLSVVLLRQTSTPSKTSGILSVTSPSRGKKTFPHYIFLFFFYFNSSGNTNIIKTSRGRPGKGKVVKTVLPDLARKKVKIDLLYINTEIKNLNRVLMYINFGLTHCTLMCVSTINSVLSLAL